MQRHVQVPLRQSPGKRTDRRRRGPLRHPAPQDQRPARPGRQLPHPDERQPQGTRPSHPCNTAILEVSESEGYLLLDELTPRRGHQQLLEQGRLHLLGHLNGVELSFATELIETDEKEGIAIYKTTLPEKLFYLQRRMDHRVATSGQRIPFRARRGRELEVLIEGYLLDLSQSGIGVILNEDQFLRKGETLANCSIRLPGEEDQPADFAMEIRFYSQGQQSRRGRLGGRFKGLDRETQRRIRQFLNKLERAQIRRQRGAG